MFTRCANRIYICIKYTLTHTIWCCIRADCAFDTHRSSNHPSFIILFQSNIPTWNSFHLLSLFSSVWSFEWPEHSQHWARVYVCVSMWMFGVFLFLFTRERLRIRKYTFKYSNIQIFYYVSRQHWNHGKLFKLPKWAMEIAQNAFDRDHSSSCNQRFPFICITLNR